MEKKTKLEQYKDLVNLIEVTLANSECFHGALLQAIYILTGKGMSSTIVGVKSKHHPIKTGVSAR